MLFLFNFFIESDLDITISGPVSPTVNRETVDFVTKVHYLPLSAGEFTVSILYKEKHIHGSPFTVKITGKVLTYFIEIIS